MSCRDSLLVSIEMAGLQQPIAGRQRMSFIVALCDMLAPDDNECVHEPGMEVFWLGVESTCCAVNAGARWMN